MFKKIICMNLILMGMLLAATVNTDKDNYTSNESIVVSFAEMEAQNSEWIAIYPGGSSNDFGNILQWKLTGATVEGNVTFDALSLGTYDVRVFNSANFLVSKEITVDDNISLETSVETTQDVYAIDEQIVAVFDNMSGNIENWIGIYPLGSSNDWANMLQWKWIYEDISGTRTFDALAAGDYEVRVFFNNSFNSEAIYPFTVEAPVVLEDLNISKAIYDPFEIVHVDYNNMRGVASDWIGVFPVGADNQKASSIQWRSANSLMSGHLTFNGLPAGAYEVRSYFDTVHQETVAFTVQNQAVTRVLYDDFESGVIDPRWGVASGQPMTLLNVGVMDGVVGNTERQVNINGQHSLRTYRDYRGGLNYAGYYFDFQNPEKKLKFLEVDVKIGVSSHVFAFGVKLHTKLGNRRIEFASWLNHTMPSGQQIIRGPYGNVLPGHRQAFTQDNYLHVHPGPSDYYVGTSSLGAGQNMFVHYKINIEEKLRVLEPDNELLGITLFTTSGGDYDNLALTSQ